MSISGRITCYQLACPSYDENSDSNKSSISIIVKCYRLNDNETKLTKETLTLKHNRFTVDKTYNVVKSEPEENHSHHHQPIRYTFDYTIDNLPSGIYSIFAHEDYEGTRESFVHPEKQAFGWSTNEKASKWTQYIISNSNTNILNANIILRKPHSFFAADYPVKTDTTRFYTINQIPVLQLNATNVFDRGYSHGYLLAPHILDWFYYYLLEENFESIEKYTEFYTFVNPASNFFCYPAEYLLEIQGILHGMQARTNCDLFIYELNRPFDLIDLLAMNSYIERRTTKPDPRTNETITTKNTAIDDCENEPNCSQVIVWNSLTADKRMIAGRNMDGECDIRRVTVSTTLLFAVNNLDIPKQYRYISLSWPGIVGILSGINETGLYCMENAGPSQIGGLIRGLTPVSYVAAHVLRTLDARVITHNEVKAAFELFAPDPMLNNDPSVWPNQQARSDLKGPICGPGSIFVLTVNSNKRGDAFVLEGDRYGGRIRSSMQTAPYIPDCIMATNHFHLYGSTPSLHDNHHNFDSYVSFSSLHRYESMRHRLEMQFRLSQDVVHLNLDNVRSLIQSACEGRTEHAIEIEIESNGNITLHIHLAASEFGMWYAPYEHPRTIRFEELFMTQS